jgi:tetratricopeptide (TPR) repeat protein
MLTEGVSLFFLHKYDSAEAYLKRAAELGPDLPIIYMWQTWTALSRKRYDWAEQAVRRLAEVSGGDSAVYLTLVAGVANPAHREAALALLGRTPGTSGQWALNADYRANWHTLLGDTATALALIERLKTRPSLNAVLNLWNPLLDPIRSSPRFRATLKKLGLPYGGRPGG